MHVAHLTSRHPFIVAHRAGNNVARLRCAESLEIPLVELDVHAFRGRLEVRHLKTLGPLPLLWDRWRLAPGWRPRLTLEQVLESAAPGTHLMLDLKGRDPALGARVARLLTARRTSAAVTVCARRWALLGAVAEVPGVRVVHSVGSRRQLDALKRRFAGRRLAGVSIHRRLLNAAVGADLRNRAELILAWPVSTPSEARQLAGWGVDGMITERFEALSLALRTDAAT